MLACGDGALLSHGCAAAHIGLHPSAPARVDVTVQTRGGRKPSTTMRVHRPRTPTPQAERWRHDAIPVTSVSRTLLDLAAIVSTPALARAVERAVKLDLFDLRAVQLTLARHPTQRGARQRVVRFTHRQVTREPAHVAATVAALLCGAR